MSRYAAQDLGKQLRRAREVAGLSVAKAADVLGVTRPMVYNYEKSKCLPAIDVLMRAANAWGATFQLAGCKVLPESSKARTAQLPLPFQLKLPYTNEERVYKQANVRIKQSGGKVFISIALNDKGRRKAAR